LHRFGGFPEPVDEFVVHVEGIFFGADIRNAAVDIHSLLG
jgi:hypothetical protein